jgi:exocyst complex protein 7
MQSEHALAGAVFEKHQANRIYSFIVPPALTIFSGVGAQMNTAIKKTLTSNPTSVGIAFTCYIELTLPQRAETFEDWIKNKAGRLGRQENELAQLSHAFRASCLRCLPEYIEEARHYGAKNTLTPQELVNVNVAPVNINTVSFVKQLTEYPDTVDGLLATLGDGNWMPSRKTANPSNSRNHTDEGYGLLSKYLGT